MMEWIGVKDRLPETTGNYYVIHKDFYRWEPIYASFCKENNIFTFGPCSSHFPSTIPIEITHWIPLPQPPKE